jgi:hypothetical protein
LVNQGQTTYDPNTNLIWLDVGFTGIHSYDYVQANLLGSLQPLDGFRFATVAEVSCLLMPALPTFQTTGQTLQSQHWLDYWVPHFSSARLFWTRRQDGGRVALGFFFNLGHDFYQWHGRFQRQFCGFGWHFSTLTGAATLIGSTGASQFGTMVYIDGVYYAGTATDAPYKVVTLTPAAGPCLPARIPTVIFFGAWPPLSRQFPPHFRFSSPA